MSGEQDEIPDFNIRLGDVHTAGMCSRGGRDWAKLHGLDWNDFLQNGISSRVMAASNDALAMRIVNHVRKMRGI